MSPSHLLQRIDIFISSPSDVAAEREIVIRAIERLNRLSYIRSRYLLNPLAYEREVPPASGTPAQLIIDRYMMEPGDCYLLICILWTRMGTPFTHPQTNERFQSGTEYEFMTAYHAHHEKGVPHLLLYRKTQSSMDADPDEKAKVDAFFEKFQGDDAPLQGLFKTYTQPAELEPMVFEHIEKILTEHPPQADERHALDANARPDIQDEVRRLDAAIPRQISVNQPTDVWAQICLPNSQGFRAKLPAYTKEGDVINREDVREGGLSVAFPLDKGTGQPLPVPVSIEVRAADFAMDEASKEAMLFPQKDSGLLVFSLTPQQVRKRSILHLIVRQKTADGLMVELGSAALSTEIKPTGVRLAAQMAWTLLSVPFTAVPLIATEKADRRGEAFSGTWKPASDPHTIKMLVEALRDSDPNIRESIAAALQEVGAPAVAPLIAALREPEPSIEADEMDTDTLSSRAPDPGEEFVVALVKIGAPAVESLITVLHDTDPVLHHGIRKQVTHALGMIGDPRAVDPLIAALRTADWFFQQDIIRALRQIGAPAVKALLVVKSSPFNSRDVRISAISALGWKGNTRAVEPLIASLRDPDKGVRSSAASALGWIGDPRAVEPLVAALGDSDESVRRSTVEALGNFRDARTVEPLIAALRDPKENIRQHAAFVLGRFNDVRPAEGLIVALTDSSAGVRRSAADALGMIGDSHAVEGLIIALTDPEKNVRERAAFALGRIGDPRAVDPLIAALHDPVESVLSAVSALERIGTPAVEPLIAALRDPKAKVRQRAASTLGEIGDARAVEPLIIALSDPDWLVCSSAATALGEIGDARAVEPLITALQDPHDSVRSDAAAALGKIGDPRAIEALTAALSDSAGYVQRIAIIALERIATATALEVVAAWNARQGNRG